MIVVADTSPLNYLIQIACDSLLPQLYGRIVIPSGVMRELEHPSAPEAVRAWITNVPNWIEVSLISSMPDAELAYLGLGEREAIQLAEEQRRLVAIRRHLITIGVRDPPNDPLRRQAAQIVAHLGRAVFLTQ